MTVQASVRADKIGQAFVFDETCTSTIVNNIVDKKARRDLSFTKQPTTVLRAATMEVMEALQKATSSGGTRKVLGEQLRLGLLGPTRMDSPA